MLCGWGAGWLISYVDMVKLCDPSLTRANLSALEMSITHIIKRYTNRVYLQGTIVGAIVMHLSAQPVAATVA